MSKEKRVCCGCGYVGYYDPIARDSNFKLIPLDVKQPRQLSVLSCPDCGQLRTIRKCPIDEEIDKK